MPNCFCCYCSSAGQSHVASFNTRAFSTLSFLHVYEVLHLWGWNIAKSMLFPACLFHNCHFFGLKWVMLTFQEANLTFFQSVVWKQIYILTLNRLLVLRVSKISKNNKKEKEEEEMLISPETFLSLKTQQDWELRQQIYMTFAMFEIN